MKYYDVDHSGYITATEFRKALADLGISVERKLIGGAYSSAVPAPARGPCVAVLVAHMLVLCAEMLRRYDADSSGALDYLELGRALFEFSQADLYMTTNQIA